MPAAAHALTTLNTQTSMPTPHAVHAAHCQPTQVRLTVGKCLDHDSMTNEVSRCSQRTFSTHLAIQGRGRAAMWPR